MSETTIQKSKHIVCPHCDSTNRLPPERISDDPKCGHCYNPLFEGRSFPLSTKSFAKHIAKSDIPVVIDFWAGWCGPCKSMAPFYEAAASKLEPNFRLFKVDTEAEPALSARYNIRSIPTIMMFKNGMLVAQQAGALRAADLERWIRAHA